MKCQLCRQPLPYWMGLMRSTHLPGNEFCIRNQIALEDPRAYEDLEVLPADPLDDPKPEDFDLCGNCKGSGQVFVRQDWQTGAYEFEPCPRCLGAGRFDE